jgi:hypothetical protein
MELHHLAPIVKLFLGGCLANRECTSKSVTTERKPIVGQGFVPAAELPLGAVRGQMKAYPSEVAPLLPRHAGQKAGGAIELKSAAHAMAELNYSWSGCAKSPPSTPDPTRPGGGNQQTG